MNPPEPIVYRIDREGRRTCDDGMAWWEPRPIPDPLGDADVTEAYRVWGLPPVYEDDEQDAANPCG